MSRTVAVSEGVRDRRWAALYVLCAGILMVILDGTIVNVALPTIQRDLGFSQSNLAWVVNSYLIAFGGLLLLAGRLGDLLGRKRILLAGLGVFTLASLLCGLSTTPEMLIGARFIQGIGGALSSAVALGMIVTMFPEPREQARAFGVYSFVASAGASIGLLAGGILTQLISWHWIFFVNVPIGIVAALFSWRLLESDRGLGLSEGADVIGAILVTAGLMVGRFFHRRDGPVRLDLSPNSRRRRFVDSSAGRLRLAPGDRQEPAVAIERFSAAQCVGRQPRPALAGRGHAGILLHELPVPAASPGPEPT